ncbi:MAG TPA: hypothetical protein EYN91_19740 [Candidatus Melainabacteria bacterium]|nr:hypothetical protein [Candidatus Melainabacteria bacterium]HIN66025.1 hypothetical protein [Candidatus Obscuribacterales bacterium]
MKIVIADQEKVDVYETEVNRILVALGHPEALVTDLSQVFDFGDDEEAADDLAELMGRSVNAGEHIWKLAQELSEKSKEKPVH